MTVADILRKKRVLIRERYALSRLGLRNREGARQWLRKRLPYDLAQLPKQDFLYRLGDVDKLKVELDELARLAPPK